MKIFKKTVILSALLLFGFNTPVKAVTHKESFGMGVLTQSLGPISWGPGLMANTSLLGGPMTSKERITHNLLFGAGMLTTAAAQATAFGLFLYAASRA